MLALSWFFILLSGGAALVALSAAIVAATRAKNWPVLAAAGASALLLLAAMLLLPPLLVGVVAFGLAFGGFWMVRRATRNASQAGRVTKLSLAHTALLAGSLLFLVPFAWLLSTSLKSDDEQAVFPPVWIPTQQITTSAFQTKDGEPAPLSWWKKGAPGAAQVAEIAELPSGAILVTPVSGESAAKFGVTATKFEVARSELTKIRAVGPRWQNYSEALAFLPPDTFYGLTFLGNTLFLTLMTVVGTLFSSSLVAYSFARLRWPGKNLLFVVLLATMMIPPAVTLMPQFLIFRGLGWVDTLRPLWSPAFFGSAFNIFLLRQFFLSIPNELEDAAKIDGCGPFATYWRVMLPQVKPALAAISIMSVLGAWNSFQGPLIYLSSPEKMPLAYGLQLYQQQYSGEPGLLMAASTLVVLPIIVLFFFTQRYFIEGASLSGLGGR